MANAAVNIKPMMTQLEPNVSIVTCLRFPSIGINQTSGRLIGGRINNGILPRLTAIPAARWAALSDAHRLLREAESLGPLLSLQSINRGQRAEPANEHRGAEDDFAG